MNQVSKLFNEADVVIFSSIYNQYFKRMVGYIANYASMDRDDAKDVVQATFEIIWDNRHRISSIDFIGGYLFTLARNGAYKFKKNLARQQELQGIYYEFISDSSVNRVFEDVELYLKIVHAILPSLPEKSQEVITLRLEGLTHEQIAEKLGVSFSTVALHSAMASKIFKSGYNQYKKGLPYVFRYETKKEKSDEASKGAHMSIQEVRQIKRLLRDGVAVKAIASDFGVAESSIYTIKNNKTFKNVKV